MRVRNRIYNLHLRFRGNSLGRLDQLIASESLTQEEIDQIQREKLSGILRHSYKHVPYYQELISSHGLVHSDGDGINLERFNELPLLDRKTLRNEFERLKADDLGARKPYRNSSGGSTGETAFFIQDQEYTDWAYAVQLLFDQWAGYHPGERKILLWGSMRDLTRQKATFRARLGGWLRSEIALNAYRMTPQRMNDYLHVLSEYQPNLVLAYPEAIFQLAEHARRSSIRVEKLNTIMTSASHIPASMKQSVKEVFGAEMFNRYGARELGGIACDCSAHQGLHISPLTHFVEILDPEGRPLQKGEAGEIVVTSLTNKSMPLIRYRIGDYGKWSAEACACGMHWPILTDVQGRVGDIFITRSGAVVLPNALIGPVRTAPGIEWISGFQFVQEAVDDVRVLLAPVHPADLDNGEIKYREVLSVLRSRLQLVMGAECKIRFEFVAELDTLPSGKIRYSIRKTKTNSSTDSI
jgi:phenylacetate-CoA ligase